MTIIATGLFATSDSSPPIRRRVSSSVMDCGFGLSGMAPG
jgi:hypothetical protein